MRIKKTVGTVGTNLEQLMEVGRFSAPIDEQTTMKHAKMEATDCRSGNGALRSQDLWGKKP